MKKLYANQAEKAKAYRERKKQAEQEKQQQEVDQYKKQLAEIEYVERKWEELSNLEYRDLGLEYRGMLSRAIMEGVSQKKLFELKKFHVLESIKRGELKP